MFRKLLVVVVLGGGCGDIQGADLGAGGGNAQSGGAGGGGESVSQAFNCSDVKKAYELRGTNDVPGMCEIGSRSTFSATVSDCDLQFQARVSGQVVSGRCVATSSGDCITTVLLAGTMYDANVHFDPGAETGRASLGRGGTTCTFDLTKVTTLGLPCTCSGSGVKLCSSAPECNTDESCVQESPSDGAYCAPKAPNCTGPVFEMQTLNGITLCAFKKKLGSCTHSSQCDSCATGTAGVVVGAACFNGTCAMRCTPGSTACNCRSGTPVGGNATGYCSDRVCQ